MDEMVIVVGADDKFHAQLWEIDAAAARAVQAGRCVRAGCGGRLDVANYPRKVRGLGNGAETAGQYGRRLSLCCAVEGCRKRATPPSVRFLGRFVYAMRVMVTWAATHGAPSTPAPPPPRSPSPARQTKARWERYWRDGVGSNVAMALLVAALVLPTQVAAPNVVVALMRSARGTESERTETTHRLLAPLTTSTVPPERARSAMVR